MHFLYMHCLLERKTYDVLQQFYVMCVCLGARERERERIQCENKEFSFAIIAKS